MRANPQQLVQSLGSDRFPSPGGQGTLNVPCWAPDSRAFAFVSYRNPDSLP
ncbi:hypothetical protein J2X15_002302 [Rhodoferax saidenbachensis]|uniref:Translocation protein TolB n=1 Tax=Rhodoferax saidenbachensis TaxID=1484693 RepID=A0ABU1ZPZ2_9BURK|nr:hypothetical protein [Rhodoferax saidenbachensis]